MGTKKIDMLNYTFQTWKVIAPSEKRVSGNAYWLCKCQICGREKEFCGSEIRLGRTGPCLHKTTLPVKKPVKKTGDYFQAESSASNKIKNEIGHKYGRLTVQSFAYTKNSKAYWNCSCECGKTTIVCGNHLRTGKTSSCGCLTSRKEEEIVSILDNYKVIYKREFIFQDLKKDKGYLRFDFAIFNNVDKLIGLIEYQGSQHYEENHAFTNNGLLQIHDQMKKTYCEQYQIPLLELNKNSVLEEDIFNWLQILKAI